MINVWKVTGENRNEALQLLRQYREVNGKNDGGYLFDFSYDNIPEIILEDVVDGKYYKAKCSAVNLEIGSTTIEVFVESDEERGIMLDQWYNVESACGITENNVYLAILKELES